MSYPPPKRLRSQATALSPARPTTRPTAGVAKRPVNAPTFQDNQNTWSPLVKQTKQSELIDKQNRITRFSQSANEQLQMRNAELFQPIYDRIQKAIDQVSAEGKFTYILDISSGAILFKSTTSFDIQPQVLAKLGVN